jgi:hypothetical protein
MTVRDIHVSAEPPIASDIAGFVAEVDRKLGGAYPPVPMTFSPAPARGAGWVDRQLS